MRILLVGPVPPHPGGGSIGRGQLAAGFARAGHDVCIVAPITEQGRSDGDRWAALHPELSVVRYPLRSFEPQPFLPPSEEFVREESSQVEPLFVSLAKSFEPDVVVVGRETFARYIPRLAQALGLPSVLLARGSPTGHILAGRFPADEAHRLLLEFRKVDRIIAVAQHLAEGLRSLGFDDVTHVPNAIDTSRFVPGPKSPALLRSLAIEPKATVVLVPANLHPRKRPADVIRSAEIALRANPGLVYVMAGTGVLREQSEQLCRARGLGDRFRFLGWVEYDHMPELMNLADLVVMASESEGLSRAYVEAMACSRLLLASDIPAAREIVEDGVNGLLFRMGDAEHLAARTLEAAARPEWRERLGHRARSSVQRRSVENAVPEYLWELARVVAARRG